MPEMFAGFYDIRSLLGCKFHEPSEVIPSSKVPRSLMDDHLELTTELEPATIPTYRKRPLKNPGSCQSGTGSLQNSTPSVTFWIICPLSGPHICVCPLILRPLTGSLAGPRVKASWHSSHCGIPRTLQQASNTQWARGEISPTNKASWPWPRWRHSASAHTSGLAPWGNHSLWGQSRGYCSSEGGAEWT